MRILREIPDDERLMGLISKEVVKAIKYLYLEILRTEDAKQNAGDALESALIKGKIYYDNGIFKGEFNKTTSKILKDLGATWSRNGYKLDPTKVDVRYLSAIAQGKMKNARDIERVLKNLMGVDIKRVATKADVKKIYSKLIENLNDGLDAQLEKFPTVRAQFDDKQLEAIRDRYTDNLELHIKGWAEDEIKALREKINVKVREGVRFEQIAKEIEAKYKLSQPKALFIARQEVRLLTSEMKAAKYEKAGIQEFRWIARKDSKVRDDHKHLDGQIFRFDDPPVIDSRTGKRGLPGVSYNCRCALQGVMR